MDNFRICFLAGLVLGIIITLFIKGSFLTISIVINDSNTVAASTASTSLSALQHETHPVDCRREPDGTDQATPRPFTTPADTSRLASATPDPAPLDANDRSDAEIDLPKVNRPASNNPEHTQHDAASSTSPFDTNGSDSEDSRTPPDSAAASINDDYSNHSSESDEAYQRRNAHLIARDIVNIPSLRESQVDEFKQQIKNAVGEAERRAAIAAWNEWLDFAGYEEVSDGNGMRIRPRE